MIRKLFLITAMLIWLSSSPGLLMTGYGADENDGGADKVTASGSGADGVEFEVVPVSVREQCSSIVLKGLRRFKGTAFVLPRVFISINRNHENLFEIIPEGNDKYLVRFAVYFPHDNEAIEARQDSSHVYLRGCNYDALLSELNSNQANPNNKIVRLASLPAQSIRLRMNGAAESVLIGSPETDILNYQGTDSLVEFHVVGKDKLRGILDRLGGKLGLGVSVDLFFTARSTNGVLNINIDTKKVAASLQGALKGKVKITDVDLQTTLSKVLQSADLKVYLEEGNSDSFSEIAKNMITRMVVDNPAIFQEANQTQEDSTGAGADTDDGSSDDWYDSSDDFSQDKALPERGAKVTSVSEDGGVELEKAAPSSGEGNNKDKPKPRRHRRASVQPGVRIASVEAVVKYFSSQNSIAVDYTQMGRKEQHVYTTSTLLKGRFDSPNFSILELPSWDEEVVVTREAVDAGNTVALFPTELKQQTVTFDPEVVHTFTKSELKASRSELSGRFPFLDQVAVSDIHEYAGSYGNIAFIYEQRLSWLGSWNIFNWNYYTWVSVTKTPKFITQSGEPMVLASDQDLIKTPIKIRFSELGSRMFSLNDLSSETKNWQGAFDADGGLVRFKAKTNLGRMEFTNTMTTKKRSYWTKMICQRKWSIKDEWLNSHCFIDSSMMLPFDGRNVIKLSLIRQADNKGVPAGISLLPQAGRASPVKIP